MPAIRPKLEKLQPLAGATWARRNRVMPGGIPFQWHHHPEYELTLTLNSRGHRFVGDHVGAYDDGDLVLVGPDLPHTWASSGSLDLTAPHVAQIIWFPASWAEGPLGHLPECAAISEVLHRGRQGLHFSARAARQARAAMAELQSLPPDRGFLALLALLMRLALDDGAQSLSSQLSAQRFAGPDRARIDRVLDHIHLHHAGTLRIEDLARIAALSPSGLHRLFRRRTGDTVSAYVSRLRIGAACALLAGTDRPIATIARDVGFASLANFNRQFLARTGKSPRAWRQDPVQVPDSAIQPLISAPAAQASRTLLPHRAGLPPFTPQV
jgi:AraC-like DNA-binding protein